MNQNTNQEFIEKLSSYSTCMKPVLEALYERNVVSKSYNYGSLNLEDYCVEQKNELKGFLANHKISNI